MTRTRSRWGARTTKRTLDIVVAVGLLVLLAPVLLVVAASVRARLGSPVLFRQRRPGRDGRPFVLYKFRSLSDARGPDGCPLPDQERMSAFGRLLRTTSLDELPELWNVLRGDMSLVGPRPLLPEYLPLFTAEQGRRHQVRPGMTGLAAVEGRNDLSWEARLARDVWYVDHWTVGMDLRILGRTAVVVLRRTGAAPTAIERFRGSPDATS